MASVACYLCGRSDGDQLVDDPPFRVKLCPCGLGYVTPRIPESHLHLLYQSDYFESSNAAHFGYADYVRDQRGFHRTFAYKAEMVRRHKKSGRVLEVGSAAGFFLHAMRESGFEVSGVEVSEHVSEFARNSLGIDEVFTGRLQDAPYERGSYDVAAMWDVIEHVSDPIAELKRVRTFMKPDGILFLQTQDIDTRFRRLLGSKWQHFKQLEHIHHFSPKTMQTMLDRAGFELVELTHKGAGKYISIEFFIDRMARYNRLVHHLLWPMRIFGRFFFYLNPGDEMIVVARPR